MDTVDIAIVGGGAAGLACAVAAAERGQRVVVLDRLARVGKKLLATGNGRCNLGNLAISSDKYSSHSPKSLDELLRAMPPERTTEFFRGLGLVCSADEEGRLYPYCRQASMVLDVLRHELDKRKVECICDFSVARIRPERGRFVLFSSDGQSVSCKKLVLAAGGRAQSALGSDGSGFMLAKALGHSVIRPLPCLVPLKCRQTGKGLKGIRVLCRATLYKGRELVCSESGELLFTDYGISGIPALQLSRFYVDRESSDYRVLLDLLPDFEFTVLVDLLKQRLAAEAEGTLPFVLLGLINKQLALNVIERAGFAADSRAAALDEGGIRALASVLKGYELRLAGTLGWDGAQATLGGVSLDEVDTGTLESRIVPGLYLVGELLDAVGACGGYNLHWAWNSALIAAQGLSVT